MLEMHTLVHTAKETRNVWDVKHVRGGMIDIEFIAQYLMLRHANAAPNLIHPATADALSHLGQAGVLAASDRDELSGALSLFKTVLQATRIACVAGRIARYDVERVHAPVAGDAGRGELCRAGSKARPRPEIRPQGVRPADQRLSSAAAPWSQILVD